jgi:hypothetical protein
MAKPGMSPNVANPEVSASTGISNSTKTSMGSRQTADSAQLSSNPNRMAPYRGPCGPSGKAEVERDEVEENQTSDKTSSTRTTYAKRKKMFDSPSY